MKLLAILSLTALAGAIPSNIQARQQTANGLKTGACKSSTFIWARGTMEPGNLGWIIGNYVAPLLTKALNGDIAIQGVEYSAGILTNIIPDMADPTGVKSATDFIKMAASKCPRMIITGGGYSQGAAIMHRTVERLDETHKQKITAMLLYGDTQVPFDGNKIKGFPPEKVKVICNSGDGVCIGGITVTPSHLSYSGEAKNGADWLVAKIKAAKAAQGSGGGSSGGESSEGGSDEAPAPKPKGGAPKGAKGGKGKVASTDENIFESLKYI